MFVLQQSSLYLLYRKVLVKQRRGVLSQQNVSFSVQMKCFNALCPDITEER